MMECSLTLLFPASIKANAIGDLCDRETDRADAEQRIFARDGMEQVRLVKIKATSKLNVARKHYHTERAYG